MQLTILGSGTIALHAKRGPSCHLLKTGSGEQLLLDSGPGCLQRLIDLGVRPSDIQAVLHSHRHLDHLADLFPLLFHYRSPGGNRREPILLDGSPGHESFLQSIAELLDPKLLSVPHTFNEYELDGTLRRLPGLSVDLAAWPANHSHAPRILRLEGQKPRPWALAYSGDTGPCRELVEAARGVDWLVVECTNSDRGGHSRHLGPADIAQVIREAKPKATALVHLAPVWTTPEEAADAVRAHLSTEERVLGCHDGTVLTLD